MTQLNTSSPRGLEARVKVPQNEEIYGGGKNKGRKGAGSAIRRRRVNRRSINIKK